MRIGLLASNASLAEYFAIALGMADHSEIIWLVRDALRRQKKGGRREESL